MRPARRERARLPDEEIAALALRLQTRGWLLNPTNGTSLFARTTLGRHRDGRSVRVPLLVLPLAVEVPLPGGGGQIVGVLLQRTGDAEKDAEKLDELAFAYFNYLRPEAS